MTNAPPSPRVRGEGRDEGAFRLGSESRRRPLTRRASGGDLSPHAGRSEWAIGPDRVRRNHAAGLVTIAFAVTLLYPADLRHNRAPEKSAV